MPKGSWCEIFVSDGVGTVLLYFLVQEERSGRMGYANVLVKLFS